MIAGYVLVTYILLFVAFLDLGIYERICPLKSGSLEVFKSWRLKEISSIVLDLLRIFTDQLLNRNTISLQIQEIEDLTRLEVRVPCL